MEESYYKNIAKGLGPRKYLGQNFLVNSGIAAMEAAYGDGQNVIELGPGLGILTRELCSRAKTVTSIEKDQRLYEILKNDIKSENLKLINDDFFNVDIKKLGKFDIMISNIPYSLSSKVIYWLASNGITALICVQKEFADHMLAKPGTREYSRLSVMTSLCFRPHHVKDVSAGNFYPMPRVNSRIIYLAPVGITIDEKASYVISLVMNHKKKRLRNAVVDSAAGLGITKERARQLSNILDDPTSRPFQLEPEKILDIANKINASLHSQNE
jgi:16S rRNA (adenine1518-N6/adenine1519-N6)-dimethyltransferase